MNNLFTFSFTLILFLSTVISINILRANSVDFKGLSKFDLEVEELASEDSEKDLTTLLFLPVVVEGTSSPFCQGDSLIISLSGLPTTGINNYRINVEINDTGVRLSINTPFQKVSATATTAEVVIQGYAGTLGDVSVTITDVQQDQNADPLIDDYQNLALTTAGTIQPLNIRERPDGTISSAGPAGTTICEGEGYEVTFTASMGTGNYDLVFDNVSGGSDTVTGIVSGVPFNVIEGIHFEGSEDMITLTEILDNNTGMGDTTCSTCLLYTSDAADE